MWIVNGKPQQQEQVQVDSGFLFGRGLFETILVNEKPVFLNEHIERMNRGLLKLNIDKKIEADYVLEQCEKFNINNCALKLIVTEKNTIITKRNILYKEEDYETGFDLCLSQLKRNPYSQVTYLKSLNYTDNTLEREKAISKGYNEVLFLII